MWEPPMDWGDWTPENMEEEFRKIEEKILNGSFIQLDKPKIINLLHFFIESENYSKAHKLLNLLEDAALTYSVSEIYSLRADIYEDAGELELALVSIGRALELEPFNEDYHFTRAVILLKMKKNEFARLAFAKSYTYSANPTLCAYDIAEELINYYLYEEAIEFLEIAYRDADLRIPALQDIVSCYEALDEPERAIRKLEEHLAEEPGDFRAWSILGKTYYNAKKYDHAVEAYQMRLALKPAVKIFIELAKTYIALNEYRKALKVLQSVSVKRGRRYPELHAYKSVCYRNTGNYSQAILELKKAGENTKEINLHEEFVKTYLAMEEYNLARKFLKLLEIENEENAWKYWAKYYLGKGNIVQAMKNALKFLSYREPHPEIWAQWAEILAESNYLDHALRLLELALTHFPDDPHLSYQRTCYLFRKGPSQTAMENLENLLMDHYEEHGILFHYCPELQNIKHIRYIINKYA